MSFTLDETNFPCASNVARKLYTFVKVAEQEQCRKAMGK